MVRRIGVVNMKGGVAKTMTAVDLAVAGVLAGHRSAVVTQDVPVHLGGQTIPQGAMRWARARALSAADVEEIPVVESDRHSLAIVVDELSRHGYDLVVIDSRPGCGESVVATAQVSDFVVIPCQPSNVDLVATEGTIRLLASMTSHPPAMALLTVCDSRSPKRFERARRMIAGYSHLYPGLVVATSRTSRLKTYTDAATHGLGVLEYEPDGRAAVEFSALWAELWSLIERTSRDDAAPL